MKIKLFGVSLAVICFIFFFGGVWDLRDNGNRISLIRDAEANTLLLSPTTQVNDGLLSGKYPPTNATACIDCHIVHHHASAENKFLTEYPGYQAASLWSKNKSGNWTRLYSKLYGILQLRIEVWNNGPTLVIGNDTAGTPIKILP